MVHQAPTAQRRLPPGWDQLGLTNAQADEITRIHAEIGRLEHETRIARQALVDRRAGVLTEEQKRLMSSTPPMADRKGLPLDTVLVGHWERLHGHGEHFLRNDGRLIIHDEGITLTGTWKLTGSDAEEQWLDIHVDGPFIGPRDLRLRMARDNRSLLASYRGERPYAETWVYVDHFTEPPR